MARKKHDIHYIYKTTCNVTNKFYVGMHSTSNLEDGYMGSGLRLRRSIRKYGVENHTKEILEYFDSREALVLREIEIVTKELIQDKMCMNLMCGGQGGWNLNHNNAFKEKLLNPEFMEMFGTKRRNALVIAHSNGVLKSVSEYYDWNGKTHSEETKKLISEKNQGQGIGETNSQYGTCWITKDGVDKKIKKEVLNVYLEDNWSKGRKK